MSRGSPQPVSDEELDRLDEVGSHLRQLLLKAPTNACAGFAVSCRSRATPRAVRAPSPPHEPTHLASGSSPARRAVGPSASRDGPRARRTRGRTTLASALPADAPRDL